MNKAFAICNEYNEKNFHHQHEAIFVYKTKKNSKKIKIFEFFSLLLKNSKKKIQNPTLFKL